MVCNLSSVVFVFLLFASTCYAISDGEVKTICNQTQNASFCFNLLGANPNASVASLTQHTIDIARENVTNTIKLIHDLIVQSEENPMAKKHYTTCLQHFGSDGALGDVEYTLELLRKGDYQGVNVAASAIDGDVEDCISGESPTDPAYDDPSDLPKYAAVLKMVVDVLTALSIHLGH